MEKFNKIYSENYQRIFKYISRLVNEQDEVSDLTQEVFLKLFIQIKADLEIQYPRTWLYRVATNECINFISRRKRNFSLETINERPASENDSFENVLDSKETQLLIQNALNKMKLSDKALLMLYSENMSYKEIAEITNIRFNSVGKKISRALDKLKIIINNDSI